jgi:hypothetical protein
MRKALVECSASTKMPNMHAHMDSKRCLALRWLGRFCALEAECLQHYNLSWCEGTTEHEILKIFDDRVVTLKIEEMRGLKWQNRQLLSPNGC